MTQGSYETAANLYKKALEMIPGSHDLEMELYLSKAYYKQNNYEACQKILNQLIIKFPQDIRIRYDLAICLIHNSF